VSGSNENQNKTLNYQWDAWGRLAKITERDRDNNGYDWSVIRDNFGRRLKTTYTPVTAGTPVTAKTETISSYFDPSVEFLEIGAKVNDGPVTWKAYGVDKNGSYGGLNGLGGLEMLLTPTKTYSIISDALGHVVATHDGTEAKRVPTQVGSYGPLPGSLALPLSSARNLPEVTHWQGRRIDPTQLVGIGERELDLGTGMWISGDPYGHFASWSLMTFCNGNPIAYCDPTGRIATKFAQDTGLKDAYYSVGDTAINAVPGGLSLLSWGMGAAMKAAGMPYGHLYQQAGAIDERLSPYARAGFYDQNSVVATAVAAGSVLVAPGSAPTKIASRGVQTVAKSGVKPLFGKPASVLTSTDLMLGRLGGELYGSQKLTQLEHYLERRGFGLQVGDEFLNPSKAGGFNAAKKIMMLRSNPTQYEVWHELAHFRQFQQLGFDKYSRLSRVQKEQFVFDLLENSPRRWNLLNVDQRRHAIDYIYDVGGFR